MKIAFVICSRTTSERLPNKVFRKINGVPLVEHLIHRLQPLDIPIILAVPNYDAHNYWHLTKLKNVKLYSDDNDNCPMKRMFGAVKSHNLDAAIRVTHDKIFVDKDDVEIMIQEFMNKKLDYAYSTTLTPGTGFEIISYRALRQACEKYNDIEFIGFAIKQVTENILDITFKDKHRKQVRLLIDFPEDLHLMELIFSKLGDDCSKKEAIQYLVDNNRFMVINDHPLISVYTCAYNAERWIKQCMESVKNQDLFNKVEYLLIDDHSTDSTYEQIVEFKLDKKNVKCIRNESNLGLASSSNRALKEARGKYIIRLDADDYFIRIDSLKTLVKEIEKGFDVVYPDNYFGHVRTIQKGNEVHHVGGALFNRDAINHLKFSEGLRAHDSLDVFLKAKEFLKLGYLNQAMFFYRQHDTSLSKNNRNERTKIKNKIIAESRKRELKTHRN